MNRFALLLAVLAAAMVGLGSGYWLARSPRIVEPPSAGGKEPLFYRHPMDPSITSPVPAKDDMNMDYIPIYAEVAPKDRKPLFYRHPMDPSITSPIPAKDDMNMDYIPVYEEADQEVDIPGLVRLSPEKVQKLGVLTAPAEVRELSRTVRATAVIEANERTLHDVVLKFDGYIEKLYVNATGQPVTRGQPLFELYSPELLAAQQEYLIAQEGLARLRQGGDSARQTGQSLARGSLERLRNFGIAESELLRLKTEGRPRRTLIVRAPASGVVMEKQAVAGMKAAAGERLFRIADLSTVWAQAEVYEQDIGLIARGQPARLSLDAYPEQVFQGRVDFIYPMLNPETRTVKVRLELPNPKGLLKPMMYARADLATSARESLAVPASALLDSGRRQVVLIERGAGRYEPRPVKIGLRGDEDIEILEGLRPGERVVVSANFLLDAESNLKAALNGFSDQTSAPSPSPGDKPAGAPDLHGSPTEKTPDLRRGMPDGVTK